MVSLTKGQKVNLKKEAPGLKKVLVGLGWDPVRGLFGSNMDIDASVICIDERGREDNLICYHKLSGYCGAIQHYGDNLTGDGDGDDEQIEICLTELPQKVKRISIIINIYSAYSLNQHFGKVRNCFVHVADLNSGKDLVRYDVDGNYKGKTAIFVADLHRTDEGWVFEAVGNGVKVGGISQMVDIVCNRL